ncbi:LysR family transcriptional regulator [Estrella lausannensis]|uniref:Putative transcriptional regulator n=1 Tax=Estrella lausannensis TaxID=483423 RepID=A0A0H5E886_9BACT|nr:LysR family transcriptional regulator [Estrella lausannensis]CRX39565.1 Putative transcriptional regulator [Estrella lausannensis]
MNRFNDLRLSDLSLFITAARMSSLSRAASHHHLSQSAASAAIQRVERALGKGLSTHEKRRFSLTKEGEALLPKLEGWLSSLSESMQSVDHMPLRIATTHAIARVAAASVLDIDKINLTLMRPDAAYGAVLRGEADIAIVLDNAPWEGVEAVEVGSGLFRLFSKKRNAPFGSVLLPEDQIEVLTMQQRWQQMHGGPVPVKARFPSWSLIADICRSSHEIGFLPEFLARQIGLHPVRWQPGGSSYRVLVLYRAGGELFQKRVDRLCLAWRSSFGGKKRENSTTRRPKTCK